MLTIHQTIGLLQRFMSRRDAAEWLETDRRYSPVIPFLQQGEIILYDEDDVLLFIKKLDQHASLRAERLRRDADERRHIHRERRDVSERRYLRHRAAANNLDRRFAVRHPTVLEHVGLDPLARRSEERHPADRRHADRIAVTTVVGQADLGADELAVREPRGSTPAPR